jgi:maleate isomerase
VTKRIGMITPSSNTVVEPTTIAITAPLYPRVTTHYTRIEVTSISLEPGSLAHFASERFLAAADLLADAGMDVIAWNGTAGAWQGLDTDVQLCEAIAARTGAAATTATIAQIEAFRLLDVRRFALAVPYVEPVRDAIVRTYAEAGLECVRSATLGISVNAEFATVPPERIRQLVADADRPEAQAISIICTNFAAGWLVPELEAAHRKPVFDSTLLTVWHALRLAGVDDALDGWGELFRHPLRSSPTGGLP